MSAFEVESWLWYGFAMVMVILRMIARYRNFKAISRLQFEDWFMVFIACLYTILIASLNVCAVTNTNLIDPKDVPTLTPQDIAERIFGSKMILLVEQCMCAVQWGTKACLLMLYWRLTENLTQGYLVKGAAVYVGGTYVIMEILYFGYWCRPFHDYWQTPTNNVQCTTALHHLIMNLAFNLSSDLLILSVPIPLFLRAHIDLKRKLLLILPFSLGFASVACAILSKHLSFTQPFSAEWAFWYVREASTVMIVSNMPYTWGLVRRVFHAQRFLKSDRSGSDHMTRSQMRNGSINIFGGRVPELRGVPLSTSMSHANSAGDLEMLGQTPSRQGEKKVFPKLLRWNKNDLEWRSERLPSRSEHQTSMHFRVEAPSFRWMHSKADKPIIRVRSSADDSSDASIQGHLMSLAAPASTRRSRVDRMAELQRRSSSDSDR